MTRIHMLADALSRPLHLVVTAGQAGDIHHQEGSYGAGAIFEFDATIPGKMSGAQIPIGSDLMPKRGVSRSLHQITQDGSEGMAQMTE
jgi:hypothetical protein